MLDKFIINKLGIKEYTFRIHNSGKDNITYEIILGNGDKFIIQQLLTKKNKKNRIFIEEVIKYINKDNNIVQFADNYLEKRFFIFEGGLFQIMKKINGNSIKIEDINIKIIENTAKYLANFHNKINNFNWQDYGDINYYKKLHKYREEANKLVKKNSNTKVKEIFLKMDKIALNLKENYSLPKGVIHGDPSFKNFLINENKDIVGLIDYDMLSVNTILWDLADLIRSYMKIDFFSKKEFKILINSYNSIRKLSDLEKKELKSYCTMMILDTGFRYLLDALKTKNNDNYDFIKKAERCLLETDKLNTFYN